MEPYGTFPCTCGKGDVVRRISKSSKNRNRVYYACLDSKPKVEDWGCGYFLWEDELQPCPCGQGLCIARKCSKDVFYKCPIDKAKKAGVGSSSSSPGPSTSPAGNFLSSSGSAPSLGKGSDGHEANYSNYKLLSMKIKILEARLDLAMHPEDHPSQSAAALHELLDGLLVEDE